METKNFQDSFIEFLKNPSHKNSNKKLRTWFPQYQEEDLQTRAEIYQGSVIGALERTLKKIFRPFLVLLGEDVSNQLFERYAEKHFSKNFDLNLYGKNFSKFIQESAPWVSEYPYVPDFADFCWQWQQVFLNRELTPTEFTEFKEINLKNLKKIVLKKADELVLIQSKFPVYEIWKRCQPEFNQLESNQEEFKSKKIDPSSSSGEKLENAENFYALYRYEAKVHVVNLRPTSWEILKILETPQSLFQLLTKISKEEELEKDNIDQHLSHFLKSGWVKIQTHA
jgi:hypothetical protein